MRMFLFYVLCAQFMPMPGIIKAKLGLSLYQGAGAALDATGKTQQYLVYARTSEWCGASGGCTLFILTNNRGT